MEVTFLIGNGYDQFLNMNTSYSKFRDWYLESQNDSENDDSIEIQLLKNSMRQNKDRMWDNLEYGIGQFSIEFDDPKSFLSCYRTLKENLIAYLTNEYKTKLDKEMDFLRDSTYKLIKLSQRVDEGLTELDKSNFSLSNSNEENLIFNYISFNYTPLFLDGYDMMRKNATAMSKWNHGYTLGQTLHIHGLLENNPIFGVDNVEQIANKKFRTNKEVVNAIVKSEINKQIGEGWREQACEIIQRSEKIYLYGVSVGETDLFWWKTLIKWFEESRSHELAIHCYLNSTNSDLEERTTAIKKVFVKYLRNKELVGKIVFDYSKKTIIVKYSEMESRTISRSSCSAKLDIITRQEFEELKKHPVK